MDNGLIYDCVVTDNYDELSFEHKSVLTFINEGSSVLEIGCHTGYFSHWIKKKNCKIVGVDIYAPAIKRAEKYLDESFVGNIESEHFYEFIKNRSFDTIVIMHVLEHLIQPDILLKKLRDVLRDEGNIIIVMPNISYWNSRLELFKGNFNYTDTGLMDKTHLRFFNYFTTKSLIYDCNYTIDRFIGIGDCYFKLVPNWKLIWRLNNIITKILIKSLRSYPNLIYSNLLFNVKK